MNLSAPLFAVLQCAFVTALVCCTLMVLTSARSGAKPGSSRPADPARR